jgi:hypothetical protein
MGLFNKAKDIVGDFVGPKPEWSTDEAEVHSFDYWGNPIVEKKTVVHPYGVTGNDHVAHVQKKLDMLLKGKDFEIVLPKPNQLQIDYDQKELPENFQDRLMMCTKAFCHSHQMLHYQVTRSMSGNLHVTVTLPVEISDTERVAWQLAFGSDPLRESTSLMSIRRNVANPTLLIERKGGSPVVTQGTVFLPSAEPQGRRFRE